MGDDDAVRRGAPPNVLFLLVDCLGARAAFDEARGARIPTLRSLMERSTVFPTCVAAATTTTPSMATLFTGTLPFVHGIRTLQGYRLDSGVPTIAEVLRDHGYRTHAEATGPIGSEQGLDRGFDVFNYRDRNVTLYEEPYWSELQRRMDALPSDRPWFFYLHLWELHHPRYVPEAFEDERYGVHRYERALSGLDQTRLSRLLELAGPNTVVALVGDHGEIPRWDRALRWTRRSRLVPLYRYLNRRANHGFDVFDDLILVPLLLSGPGVPAGRRIQTQVRHADLFPTLVDLAGIREPVPGERFGESVVPLFAGDGPDRPGYSEAVGVAMGSPRRWQVSVRDGGWKLVTTATGRAPKLWKLPDERRDRAAEHPEVRDRLVALLEDIRSGASIEATGEELSEQEAAEVEARLRDLGYIE